MVAKSFFLRLVGLFWFFVGLFMMVLGAGYVLVENALNTFFFTQFPSIVPITSYVAEILSPGWIEFFGIAFGIFCLVLGLRLAILTSWARTVAMAFHLLLAVYNTCLIIAAFVFLNNPSFFGLAFPSPIASSDALLIFLAVGLVLVLIPLALGLYLSTSDAVEVFSPRPRQTVRPKQRCEFCGAELDEAGRCPACEPDARRPPRVTKANLVSLDDGKEYSVSVLKPTLIGRELPSNDVILDNPTVSREHVKIEYLQGRFMLYDLQSANGTFVNEQKIRQRQLQDGDEVRFGRARFKFRVES